MSDIKEESPIQELYDDAMRTIQRLLDENQRLRAIIEQDNVEPVAGYVTVPLLVRGETAGKVAAWQAFLAAMGSEMPTISDGSYNGTYNHAVQAAVNAYITLDHNPPKDSTEPASKEKWDWPITKHDIDYPRDIFNALIHAGSPYAFYIFQWVPYQTEANRWRLKMCHDVKHFDGRIEYGVWPNGSHCGSFKDEDVEFIRISRKQHGREYLDPRTAEPTTPKGEKDE